MTNCRPYIKNSFKAIGIYNGLYGNTVQNSPKEFTFFPSFKNRRKQKMPKQANKQNPHLWKTIGKYC